MTKRTLAITVDFDDDLPTDLLVATSRLAVQAVIAYADKYLGAPAAHPHILYLPSQKKHGFFVQGFLKIT